MGEFFPYDVVLTELYCSPISCSSIGNPRSPPESANASIVFEIICDKIHMKNAYGQFYSVTFVKWKFTGFSGCTYCHYAINPKILILAECEFLMLTHLSTPWHRFCPYCCQVISYFYHRKKSKCKRSASLWPYTTL